MDHADVPDLSDAEIYVEAGRPIASGRWHILPDDTVIYERPTGEFELKPVIAAHTLRSRPTWTRLQLDDDASS